MCACMCGPGACVYFCAWEPAGPCGTRAGGVLAHDIARVTDLGYRVPPTPSLALKSSLQTGCLP